MSDSNEVATALFQYFREGRGTVLVFDDNDATEVRSLIERLQSWAQNEEMVDSAYTQHGRDIQVMLRLLGSGRECPSANAPPYSPTVVGRIRKWLSPDRPEFPIPAAFTRRLMQDALAAIEQRDKDAETRFEQLRVALRERDEARQLHNIAIEQRDAEIANLEAALRGVHGIQLSDGYMINVAQLQEERDRLKAALDRISDGSTGSPAERIASEALKESR